MTHEEMYHLMRDIEADIKYHERILERLRAKLEAIAGIYLDEKRKEKS